MDIAELPNKIVLFDGVCNLCNGAVQFILKRDTQNQLSFASLQSEAGQALQQHYGLDSNSLDSFVFVNNGKAYTRASAALRLSQYLSAGWPLLQGLRIIPRFISNGVYNFIAKNRYRWFGKRDECMLPTPALRSRFLN